MTKIYTYKNCSTCKKATRFLKENNIIFDEIPIRETPPTIDELSIMLNSHDGEIKQLFNRSGKDYRELNMKEKLKSMPNEIAIKLLNQNGNLVKRPFLLSNKRGLVGFNELTWTSFFSS